MDKPVFELEITLRGPEESYESQYGPRTQRDTLARLDIPVTSARGWQIYQEAIRRALEPDFILTLPNDMTPEQAEELRAEWMKNRA